MRFKPTQHRKTLAERLRPYTMFCGAQHSPSTDPREDVATCRLLKGHGGDHDYVMVTRAA